MLGQLAYTWCIFYFYLGSRYCLDVCGSGIFDGFNSTRLRKSLVLAHHLYFLSLYFKIQAWMKGVYRLVCGMVVNLYTGFCCMELRVILMS